MPQQQTEQVEKVEKTAKQGKLAVLLVRNTIGLRPEIKKTIIMLGLLKKHACAVIEDTPSNRGMLVRVKDYVAWGNIDEQTFKELVSKRGNKESKLFHLHPPRGGFERKGIKTTFPNGGVLGFRGDKINDLLRKML